MRESRASKSSETGRVPALGSVRKAFGRLDKSADAGVEAAATPEPSSPLLPLVIELLAVEDFNVSGAERQRLERAFDEALRVSAIVTHAAFDWVLVDALDDAHRALYALYADRVWRAPKQPRPEYADTGLRRIRMNLEFGFRHHLARKRGFRPLVKADTGQSTAYWVQSLAFGPHPHDAERWGEFARENVSLDQLKEVVAQRSLFFLREPDPWVYAIPTLNGVAKAGLLDLLLDEYGWGKLERMHSSIYEELLEALGLPARIDHFESSSSWQYLATLNHQWMCALTPEHSHRLLGTIYLTEATSPDAMTNYLAAWKRLGIVDPAVTEFYELHVTADENHREVALNEVVLPACGDDPAALQEVATGIFDARTLEAEFADHLVESFSAGRSSLSDAHLVAEESR